MPAYFVFSGSWLLGEGFSSANFGASMKCSKSGGLAGSLVLASFYLVARQLASSSAGIIEIWQI